MAGLPTGLDICAIFKLNLDPVAWLSAGPGRLGGDCDLPLALLCHGEQAGQAWTDQARLL